MQTDFKSSRVLALEMLSEMVKALVSAYACMRMENVSYGQWNGRWEEEDVAGRLQKQREFCRPEAVDALVLPILRSQSLS